MSGILPNCFQMPNDYIDRAMSLLTAQEFMVLSFAVRHIFGWQDRIDEREWRISLTMFEKGYTTKQGKVFGGCGLTRAAITKALEALEQFGFLEKRGEANNDGQMWHISDSIQWGALESRAQEKLKKNQDRTKKATKARQSGEGGTSDVPVRATYQKRYVGRTESKPIQNHVLEGARKRYPIFYTVGMRYADGKPVDPATFPEEVNVLFYAYFDVLKDVQHPALATYDYLWEKHRDECKSLALARVTADQLQGYVRSKYDANNKLNDFWINRDDPLPLSNVVKSIGSWIKRQDRQPGAAQSDEAKAIVEREARRAAAMAEEQAAAQRARREMSA